MSKDDILRVEIISTDNSVNTDCFEMFLVPFEKSFLRAFSSYLDC